MATIERHVTRNLTALDGASPCSEAARLMAEQNIGSVAVREGSRVVGLITERDLVRRVVAGGSPSNLPIREIMERFPMVPPTTSETECTALMRDHYTRHLLVEENGEVIGVISMRDLIRLMLDEKEWLIGQLHSFIDGHGGPRASVS
ncbi:MAG TPA: CBS domain-containing protein [Anaeromyxobacteraceae bacterium]|nr:CBS domain-containing protein [Anaeromyxobacteraceae bacterium]